MTKTIRMTDMTSKEIEEAIKKGFVTVVIPIGAVEAHGPHLPTATDSIMAEVLGERIGQRLRNTLVAPTIPFGPAEVMRSFPGTISLRPEVLKAILEDYCRALGAVGIKNLVIFSMHGGNYDTIKNTTPLLVQQFPKLNIISLANLGGFLRSRNEILSKYRILEEEGGYHAGASETSEMLAIRSDLVHMNYAARGLVDGKTTDIYANSIAMARGFGFVNSLGISGDPTKSTLEMGQRIVEALVDFFVTEARIAMKELI